ncbi:unnamed protein product, partial [Mesorhabditis belari]|uniref:Protein kinase domain-containing protein n=1 Tax=Mesorhabditis belari TaxID=2138241 RepID=A0AAF3EC81_9BILA
MDWAAEKDLYFTTKKHIVLDKDTTLATGSFGLKLAGFGNSRREGEPKNYPITSASDVYSAAVLIWEIVEKSEAHFDDVELEHRPFAAKFSHIKDIPLKEPSLFEKLQKLIESGTQLEAKDRTPVFAALLTTKGLRKQHTEWLKLKNGENLCELCLKSYVHDNQTVSTPEIRKVTPTVKLALTQLLSIDHQEMETLEGIPKKLLTEQTPSTSEASENASLRHHQTGDHVKGLRLRGSIQPAFDFKTFQPTAMDEIQIPVQFLPEEELADTDFNLLSRGDFGTIFTLSGLQLVAETIARVTLKRVRIDPPTAATELDARFLKELHLSQTYKHSNIITFYKDYGEPSTDDPTKFTHYCWISERMDPLEKYYESQRRRDCMHGFAVRDIRLLCELMTQPLRALDYLHSFGVFGLNLSPRSISIKEGEGTFIVKISDFGLINDEIHCHTKDLNALIYKSIEVLEGKPVGSCADIWAIGTIAIEFLGVKLFMPTGSVEEIAEKITQNGPAKVVLKRIETVLKNFDQISNEWRSRVEKDLGAISILNFIKLMKSMLERRPLDRPIVESCLKDPFLTECNVNDMREARIANE